MKTTIAFNVNINNGFNRTFVLNVFKIFRMVNGK